MTRSIVTAVFLILSALAVSSCAGGGRRTAGLSRLENTSIEVRDFVTRMQSNGAICFDAWGGEDPCCDRDVTLVFFPDETAEMIISGNNLRRYSGTYRLRSSGGISAEFRTYGSEWPDMVITRDQKSLLLQPARRVSGSVGERFQDKATFWPLRMEVCELVGDHVR